MNIIVVGAGKVGRKIVNALSNENHNITIVDNNSVVIDEMSSLYDCATIQGNGASLDTLIEAGIEKANALIATTESDEVNILSCLIADKFGVAGKIARVRSYSYASQNNWMIEKLGISRIINPEYETSIEIQNILNFPEALRVESFARGKADLVELYVQNSSPLIGKTLQQIHTEFDVKILVCAVERNGVVIIPKGNFTFEENDLIFVTASRQMLKDFIKKINNTETRIKDVLIIGGGKIALYLASNLSKNKYNVKIIERNLERCNELADELVGVDIIHGNGSEHHVLSEENLENMDAIICLTGNDEENIILSLYSEKNSKGKIITKVNTETYNQLIPETDRLAIVSPKDISASHIISYVRSLKVKFKNNMENLYTMVDGQVEVVEFKAVEGNKVLDIPLKNLKLSKEMLLATIIREEEVIIPSGNDFVKAGDTVVVVSHGKKISKIDDILR